jgi:AraC family transcriptional regulator
VTQAAREDAPHKFIYRKSYDAPTVVRLGKVAILSSITHRSDMNVTASSCSGITSTRRLIAAGRGWRVSDIEFRADTEACLLEDRHEDVVIGAIIEGSFRYRSTHGSAILTPGALLLGNAGDPFECTYEHTLGDRCISFYYTPDFFEHVARAIPIATRFDFGAHRIPPTPAMIALTATVEAESVFGDALRAEEVALQIAGGVLTLLNGAKQSERRPSRRDENRILDALHVIETRYSEPLSIAELARETCMSSYHFLRVFRDVVGVTPYQFLVRTRLRHAAIGLATTDEPVSAVALANGFGDLSTFISTFRRVFGLAPREYRTAGGTRRIPNSRGASKDHGNKRRTSTSGLGGVRT